MEIQYYGGNCVRITAKKASLVIDDNLTELGGKAVGKAGDIALFTTKHKDVSYAHKLLVDSPGEYEVSDISITGIPTQAHMDEKSSVAATMYKILADDFRIAVVGHIFPALSEAQLETLGTIDILIIPVGGNGFTLDPAGALQVIKKIEPKLVIPTNYADAALNYEVPAQDLETALKTLAMEVRETVPKLKLKGTEAFPEQTQLVVLERQG